MRLLHLLAVIAMVALATPVLAQPFPSRLGSVATDTTLLDEAAVNLAADRLADVGVEALALLLEAPVGVSLAAAEAYLDAALERYGFSGGDAYLVVFVGLQPLPASGGTRPLIIDYGAPLVGILERTSNGLSLVDSLYDDLLVPMLQAGDTTGALRPPSTEWPGPWRRSRGRPSPTQPLPVDVATTASPPRWPCWSPWGWPLWPGGGTAGIAASGRSEVPERSWSG